MYETMVYWETGGDERGAVTTDWAEIGPVLAGGGKRALPAGVHAEVELVDERRFGNGTVYLRYRL
jgi:hypothetical protein